MEKLLRLARKGDLEAVLGQLARDPSLLNAKSAAHNRTLLWEATRRGRRELVETLVERGADVNIPGRHRHESFVLLKPYCVAVTYGREELASYLLARGTIVDAYSASYLGEEGRLLDWIEEDPRIVNRELEEDTVWRVTPLHYAVSGGRERIVDLLLERGAEVREYSSLLLDIAARRKRLDLVRTLLDAGAEASETPVFGALYAASHEILELLVRTGST
jgi:ankyrin repeat protein